MLSLLIVAAGGAIGAALRYIIHVNVAYLVQQPFPYATLSVNILGCFLAGAALGWFSVHQPPNEIKLFIMIGILGGFTTFSSFAMDAVMLMQQGRIGEMLAYIVISTIVSICAVLLGTYLIWKAAG